MKSHVAIYSTHAKALEAISLLSEKRFPMEHVSLIGKADIINDNFKVKSLESIKFAPMGFFSALGLILGVLAGVGVITIPGIDLADSGAMIGAFVGLDLGLILGAIAMMLAAVVLKDSYLKSDRHKVDEKYLIIVHGTNEEVETALRILNSEKMTENVYKERTGESGSNWSLSMA